MEWNEVIGLVKVDTVADKRGISIEVESEPREVFANRRKLTLSTFYSFHQSGLDPSASFEVRSQDYEGEQRCIHEGLEYDISWAQDRGEWTVLTLVRRLGNA